MADDLSIWLTTEDSSDIDKAIKHSTSLNYRGIITEAVNSEFEREFIDESLAIKQQCFTRSPLILDANDWQYKVLPSLTPKNIAVDDEELRKQYELEFLQEYKFTQHIKSGGPIKVSLTSLEQAVPLANLLKPILLNEIYEEKIYIELQMIDLKSTSASTYYSDEEEDEGVDQWAVWNEFLEALGDEIALERVYLALVMSADLPSDEEIKRWIGERVRLLVIQRACFTNNANNYPVLSVKHKDAVVWFMQYTKCDVAIENIGGGDSDVRVANYQENIRFLYKNRIDRSHSAYTDSLRYPLQPLNHNLDTFTYEQFETDPKKYKYYQRAIEAAIIDKVPESEIEKKRLVLIVLGAGRGPLVRASINASKNTGRKLKIFIVEKNPNAIVTLTSLLNVLWPNEDITLISQDMRTVELEEKADILVSELLGSFGDNELSPECLDGAQRLLKPDGISIPCNSISFLRPEMTRKLHILLKRQKIEDSKVQRKNYSVHTEVGWVCFLGNVYHIDEPKEFATFLHPNLSSEINNYRYSKLPFTAKLDCVLHGFAGYFTSKLYKNIEISILPSSHTPGMMSWYPFFLPINEALHIKKDETFTIEIWRKTDPDKVWYEWRVNEGDIHNKDGEIHPVFLSS